MKDFSGFSRYEEIQELSSYNQLLCIPNYLKTCPVSFLGAQCFISAVHTELLWAVLEVSSCSSAWFNPCRDRWEAPTGRSNLWLLCFQLLFSFIIMYHPLCMLSYPLSLFLCLSLHPSPLLSFTLYFAYFWPEQFKENATATKEFYILYTGTMQLLQQ